MCLRLAAKGVGGAPCTASSSAAALSSAIGSTFQQLSCESYLVYSLMTLLASRL
jgi:hypothetical protein